MITQVTTVQRKNEETFAEAVEQTSYSYKKAGAGKRLQALSDEEGSEVILVFL